MTLLLLSLVILAVSSFSILVLAGSKKITSYIFLWSLITACGLGVLSALGVLSHWTRDFDFRVQGYIPLGEFHIGIDFLSAFFLLLSFILFLAAGIYGYGYLRDYTGKRNVSVHFAIYHLLIIAMAIIFVAKNAILFLVAWELMTFLSYFLITFDNESEQVRKAGYIYLIATHTGTFCLLAMFLLMGHQAGSMNFDQMTAAQFPLGLAAFLFVMAIFGFGVKAGFIPFHIWLPHAHPAAPTHISAILSGVVIKIGIYGLMRMIFLVKDFPLWCGILLLAMAAVSGVGGVLYALGQHEIKKLLAYHSIENIGIIALGLGIGMIGHFYHQETVAFIGYTAALLHTFNHAMFKGLLFLSAGSVIRLTHTGDMEHMGGLLKLFPWSGYLFLVGSLSICGLPPFNGFISEWLAYRAFLEGVLHFDMYGIIFSIAAILVLALIGGLAAICFAKAFGVVFLGNSRTSCEHHYKECDALLAGPMVLLAGVCLWGGLFPVRMVSYALEAAQTTIGRPVPFYLEEAVVNPLVLVTRVLLIGVFLFLFFSILRKKFNAYPVRRTETWSCGYAGISSRMQYTASSFAKPILKIFRLILFFRVETKTSGEFFPSGIQLSSSVKDVSEDSIFRPLFYGIKKISRKLKWIQSGRIQSYILYIFFLLVILLIWKLR